VSAWARLEVEAIVDDYLKMLAAELAGVRYNKAEHRRALLPKLSGRSEQSVEFKHANISAALIDLGFPYIAGYKPRANYQSLLADVLRSRLFANLNLLDIAGSDADRPTVTPEVDDILSILTAAPSLEERVASTGRTTDVPGRQATNYIEREARNRSLGAAGEELVLAFERARLIRAGCESLAEKIEHTSVVKGDYEGYDILSFGEDGSERLVEVKTTKYGQRTPFFVTRNELTTSQKYSTRYHVYRRYTFSKEPSLYLLPGSIETTCHLWATTFSAAPK
jgi:hypothetical protein